MADRIGNNSQLRRDASTCSGENISVWLSQMKRGDREGVDPIFVRYFGRLAALAANKLRMRPDLAGMEEDVALSALKSLCLGAEKGRYSKVNDRDDLWRLLACMTVRKTIDLMRKRGMGLALDENDYERLFAQELSPADLVEVNEHIEMMLNKLEDPTFQKIVLWKVEGYSNREIAERLSTVERTVERKLHRIRLLWQDMKP